MKVTEKIIKIIKDRRLYKSATVELWGLIVYLTLTPLFVDHVFKNFNTPFFWFITLKWVMAVPFVAAVSFLSKYLIYRRWMFK